MESVNACEKDVKCDQLLLAARQVHVVYLDQLFCAAHCKHFISYHFTSIFAFFLATFFFSSFPFLACFFLSLFHSFNNSYCSVAVFLSSVFLEYYVSGRRNCLCFCDNYHLWPDCLLQVWQTFHFEPQVFLQELNHQLPVPSIHHQSERILCPEFRVPVFDCEKWAVEIYPRRDFAKFDGLVQWSSGHLVCLQVTGAIHKLRHKIVRPNSTLPLAVTLKILLKYNFY